MKRKPRRPGNLIRGAGLPIVRFVPSKENPRTGFDDIGIRDRCPKKAVDRLYMQYHLIAPLQHRMLVRVAVGDQPAAPLGLGEVIGWGWFDQSIGQKPLKR